MLHGPCPFQIFRRNGSVANSAIPPTISTHLLNPSSILFDFIDFLVLKYKLKCMESLRFLLSL